MHPSDVRGRRAQGPRAAGALALRVDAPGVAKGREEDGGSKRGEDCKGLALALQHWKLQADCCPDSHIVCRWCVCVCVCWEQGQGHLFGCCSADLVVLNHNDYLGKMRNGRFRINVEGDGARTG